MLKSSFYILNFLGCNHQMKRSDR